MKIKCETPDKAIKEAKRLISINGGNVSFVLPSGYVVTVEGPKENQIMEIDQMITDKELESVFAHSNFGSSSKRDIVRYALLKVSCGYHNGHTSHCIIRELGLITKSLELTKKGKEYLYESFRNGTNH